MKNTRKKANLRIKRKKRIRKKLQGTAERPRLSIYRSARHVYAQVIDDLSGKTVASVNSYKNKDGRANSDECSKLGKQLAELCKQKEISSVVFDKNGFAYHGRVKAFADGVREGGIQF